MSAKLKIALLCGGPSLERGISLNSARSVCDHLGSSNVQIEPIYFDQKKRAFRISRSQLYSNTPGDFDFKLQQTAKPLNPPSLRRFLKSLDLAFPAMHGPFGEDGGVQALLESVGLPFVGSSSTACKLAFDKHRANEFIRANGFHALPSIVLERGARDHSKKISEFFKQHKIKRAIVKPATGGSSIAVYSVSSVKEAVEKAKVIFADRVDRRVVLEPFCEGREFTVIILENRFGSPTAILPTEIELDYRDHQIFDYRKKYLATRQVTYHCPPRFDDTIIERIQTQAEQLFLLFGMRDMARFDGWVLPDGNLWFSDFNLVSGMEQNSFLFMQAARLGMTHRDLLRFVVQGSCKRAGLTLPEDDAVSSAGRKPVHVIFGGDTAERQVSLMSGTNVWLKLRRSKKYRPEPFLLDANRNVWHLPYGFALNHTVEEITEMCLAAEHEASRLDRLRRRTLDKLSPEPGQISEHRFLPEKMSLEAFIKNSPRVFLGLHGGIGEDGTIQKALEQRKISFNGCGSKAAKLGMNKFLTAQALKDLEPVGIFTARKEILGLKEFKGLSVREYSKLWKDLCTKLGAQTVIVKPIDDGCSAGIVRLFNAKDLRTYVGMASRGAGLIPAGAISEQHGIIEMPTVPMKRVMFEPFIETDKLRVLGKRLICEAKTKWMEITVGVLERNGKLHALSPSITVAVGNVLSLEEKFQGGTGVNITPPPTSLASSAVIAKVKSRIEQVAKRLGIRGYARIDAFMHRETGEILVIEANTLPGLTPSTVIYHQALAEKPALYPTEFLELIIEAGNKRY